MKYYIDLLVNKGSRHLGILLAISLSFFDKAAEILLATRLVTVSSFLSHFCRFLSDFFVDFYWILKISKIFARDFPPNM